MPDTACERQCAETHRDLADPTHSRASLRASLDRRVAAVRRRRATRGGHSAVAALLAVLALGSAGALAHESGGAQAGDGTTSSSQARPASAPAEVDVAAVQRRLGIDDDGALGPQTRRAIKRFQRRNGLPATGRLDAATLRALGVTEVEEQAGEASAPSARLERIAQCESGGDPTAVSPDGRYRGKYQFSRETWRGLGGTGDPAAAPEAEQDRRAAELMRRQGPSAWPSCSRR